MLVRSNVDGQIKYSFIHSTYGQLLEMVECWLLCQIADPDADHRISIETCIELRRLPNLVSWQYDDSPAAEIPLWISNDIKPGKRCARMKFLVTMYG